MIVNEGQKDGYALVLHIPDLPGIMKQYKTPDTLSLLGLPLLSAAMMLIIFGNNTFILGAFALLAVALLYSAFMVGRRKRKMRKLLNELGSEVTSAVVAECHVVPQENIRIGFGKTDFIAVQPDGAEMFWDLTPLDEDGRIGLKSRFQTS